MFRTIKHPGYPLGEGQNVADFFNRSGGACLLGGAYIVDEASGDAASTSWREGLKNVVLPTTALIKTGMVVICAGNGPSLALPADDSSGKFFMGQGIICRALVESTTDITKDDPLKLVNGQAYFVKATAGTDRWHAKALESRTSNDTGLIWVRLMTFGSF